MQQRIKQDFFRRAVLASYRGRCCISGVGEPRLLIASHIVPWREDKANRLNPSNGLCLSAIHDKAFDSYLFSLTDDGRVVLSAALKASRMRSCGKCSGQSRIAPSSCRNDSDPTPHSYAITGKPC